MLPATAASFDAHKITATSSMTAGGNGTLSLSNVLFGDVGAHRCLLPCPRPPCAACCTPHGTSASTTLCKHLPATHATNRSIYLLFDQQHACRCVGGAVLAFAPRPLCDVLTNTNYLAIATVCTGVGLLRAVKHGK